MTNSAFEKALEILNEDEKTALYLAKVDGKNTWEAGEIMGKSHYKYIEILQRATEFSRLFTEHYGLYETLIPDEIGIQKDVKEYLIQCIEKRKKPTDVYKSHTNPSFKKSTTREKLMGRELLKWRTSDNSHEQYFYHLVMTFDRWNNYRILPPAYQEPHAFKRRQKNRHRRIITLTSEVPVETLMGLWEDYGVGRFNAASLDENGVYYTYLAESLRDSNYKLVKVTKTAECIEAFTDQKIYLFRKPEDCTRFVEACIEYLVDRRDKLRRGLKFWPLFRVLIKKAINHHQMERISSERTPYVVTAHTKNSRKKEIQDERIARGQ